MLPWFPFADWLSQTIDSVSFLFSGVGDVLFLLSWIVYGLIVGSIVKFIHPAEDQISWFSTILIGVVGSYVGNFIAWLLGFSINSFSPSGVIMGTIGGLAFCWVYRTYRLNRFFKIQGRMPFYKIPK